MILTDIEQLRTPCTDVESIEEADAIIAQLEKELAESSTKGVGLAAPQIGIWKKVAIIRIPGAEGNKGFSIDLVNASITKKFNQRIKNGEGCLSFPGTYIKTLRYDEIVVEGNLKEPRQFVATDVEAWVIQHEIGHYLGELLIDFEVR